MSETDLGILCRTLQCQQLLSSTYPTHNPFYSFDLEPTSVSSSNAKSQWLLRFKTAYSALELFFSPLNSADRGRALGSLIIPGNIMTLLAEWRVGPGSEAECFCFYGFAALGLQFVPGVLHKLWGPPRQTSELCSGLSLIITDLFSFFSLSMAKSVLAKLTRLELGRGWGRGDICMVYDQNLF